MASESSSTFTESVQKCHGGEASDSLTGDGEDRISNLPDEILGDILSSFPTKEAVRTSVLSSRWRYVWTVVPYIEIKDDLNIYNRKVRTPESIECFGDFVDRVLSLNKVCCLPKMILSCRNGDDYCGRFFRWIRALSIRDIDELYLEYSDPRVKLPHCIFMCKKLVILKLNTWLVLDVPTNVVHLHRLKVLRLSCVLFCDENSLNNILAGCPVLEELNVEWDLLDRTKATTLYIQSTSLKSLTVYVPPVIETINCFIDTTNLERLNVRTHSKTERFEVHSNLFSLVSAEIEIWDLTSENSIELLRKMSSTKYLNLSHRTMESLDQLPLSNLPMFPYLSHLEVEVIDFRLPVLPYLLGCSPNLITFDMYSLYSDFDLDEVEFVMPNCSLLHLESVNMKDLGTSRYEMDMVKYFLKYAPVLKKMSISFFYTPEDSNLSHELLVLPRASTKCELEVFSYSSSARKYICLSQSYQD